MTFSGAKPSPEKRTMKITERLCSLSDETQVLPEMSADGFRLLRDRSILYSQKGQLPKYKLNAIDAQLAASDINVNYFYCEPTIDE